MISASAFARVRAGGPHERLAEGRDDLFPVFTAQRLEAPELAAERREHGVGQLPFAQLPERLGDPAPNAPTVGLPGVAEQRDEGADRTLVPDLGERFDRPRPEQGVLVPKNGREGWTGCRVLEPSECGGRVAARSVAFPEDAGIVLDLASGRPQTPDVDPDIVLIRLSLVTDLLQDLGEEVEQGAELLEILDDPGRLEVELVHARRGTCRTTRRAP